MNNCKTITTFEHSRIKVDAQLFTEQHLTTLDRWCCSNKNLHFEIGRNSVKFSEYVGVIKVHDLIIEILPKIGKYKDTKIEEKIWRNALIEMLMIGGIVKNQKMDAAEVKTVKYPILDIVFDEFLNQVKEIIHKGLFKNYIHYEKNLPCVKGKILFERNTTINHSHKERSYCSYTEYSENNIINQVLKYAVTIVFKSARTPSCAATAKSLLFNFDSIENKTIYNDDIERISLNRKNMHYKYAVKLAKMIIKGYIPSISPEREDVFSILFDMNELYEKYVYSLLKKTEKIVPGLHVYGQKSKRFWGNRCLRPDIILEYGETKKIIDTKWKIPLNNTPNDQDLKQMFAYNRVFNCKHSYLLYPETNQNTSNRSGTYSEGSGKCTMQYLKMFDPDMKVRKSLFPEVLSILELQNEMLIYLEDL